MNITKLLAKYHSWAKMTKKEENALRKKLRDKADQVFSLRVRTRDKDKWCVTCWWPVQHNAHRIDRWWYSHRWSEDNCCWACVNCNTYHAQEHWMRFTIFQIKRFGQERVDKNLFERNKIKPRIDELLSIIEKYSLAINDKKDNIDEAKSE